MRVKPFIPENREFHLPNETLTPGETAFLKMLKTLRHESTHLFSLPDPACLLFAERTNHLHDGRYGAGEAVYGGGKDVDGFDEV